MNQDTAPISAFAAYKRKSMEQLSPSFLKKIKQKRLPRKFIVAAANKAEKFEKQKTDNKKASSKMITGKRDDKCALNTTMKVKKDILKKNVKKNLMLNKILKQNRLKMTKFKKKAKTNLNIINKSILIPMNEKEPYQELSHKFNHAYACQEKQDFNNPFDDSLAMLKWLIHPLNVQDFFTRYFESTPIHIKRKRSSYYSILASTPLLDKILRQEDIYFGKNLDITSYCEGIKEVHTPQGRAVPSVVWDFYKNKCSVRMLNPQTFIPAIFKLNASLQEIFDCFVGANLYLTPPNSQGFAPHYDDIEAFVLQLEGKKRWRLYKPPYEGYLARFSSKNFDQSELGKPILDTILTAGSLLYFPRGVIHQAETIDDTHSLHITLSVYQKNSWYDFLEKLLSTSLKRAVENDYLFRVGLPVGYLKYCGLVHSDNIKMKTLRKDFRKKIITLFNRLIRHINMDDAADWMAKEHIHDFLPPFLNKKERIRSVTQDGEIMMKNGIVKDCEQIECNTSIRLLRSHCIRLVKEENNEVLYKLYYSTENSKEYHQYEPMFLEIDESYITAIKQIIRVYPNFIRVGDLLIDNDEIKIQIATDLWEKGLVITKTKRGHVNKDN